MDKYEIVFDIIGHPEKYSADRLMELFANNEIAEAYNLICNTHAAVKSHSASVNVEDEWRRFSMRHRVRGGFRRPVIGRVASIAVLFLSSLVAIAVGYAVKSTFAKEKSDSVSYVETKSEGETISIAVMDNSANVDSQDSLQPVLFEDETLGNIMQVIGRQYDMKVNFRDEATAGLRLYYKFDPDRTIEETVESLNIFDGINIHIEDNILFID